MTSEEFVIWLRVEVGNQRMTESEMNDLLEQKRLFDDERSIIESKYYRRVVGYIAGHRRVANGIHQLIDGAKAQFPDKMIYFEPIGFTLL